jgi:hypothetical protein
MRTTVLDTIQMALERFEINVTREWILISTTTFKLRKNNWMKNKQEKNIISGKTTLLYRRFGQLSGHFQYSWLSKQKNKRYRTKTKHKLTLFTDFKILWKLLLYALILFFFLIYARTEFYYFL